MSDQFPTALSSGVILAGQYVIDRPLGQGGFGITYLAHDHKTSEKVVIKEFFPDSLASRTGHTDVTAFSGERGEHFEYGKGTFLQEAETLAEFLGNKNIVKIYSYFEENGTAYFVMEYVDGVSLDVYLKNKGGRISYEETEKYLVPIMEALGAVHKKGIIHRDVTPDNIYIANDGTVKLLDFGAARYSLGDKSRSLDVVLKHGFAPKEQYTRHGRQGPYTDVYAVAASFYFCMTGKRPPDSIDRLEHDEIIFPSAMGINIPRNKEAAIMKGLSVQPKDRFQTMEEFKSALLNSQFGQPVQQIFFGNPNGGINASQPGMNAGMQGGQMPVQGVGQMYGMQGGQRQMPPMGQNQVPQMQSPQRQVPPMGQNQSQQMQSPQRQMPPMGQNQSPQMQSPQRQVPPMGQNQVPQMQPMGQNQSPSVQGQMGYATGGMQPGRKKKKNPVIIGIVAALVIGLFVLVFGGVLGKKTYDVGTIDSKTSQAVSNYNMFTSGSGDSLYVNYYGEGVIELNRNNDNYYDISEEESMSYNFIAGNKAFYYIMNEKLYQYSYSGSPKQISFASDKIYACWMNVEENGAFYLTRATNSGKYELKYYSIKDNKVIERKTPIYVDNAHMVTFGDNKIYYIDNSQAIDNIMQVNMNDFSSKPKIFRGNFETLFSVCYYDGKLYAGSSKYSGSVCVINLSGATPFNYTITDDGYESDGVYCFVDGSDICVARNYDTSISAYNSEIGIIKSGNYTRLTSFNYRNVNGIYPAYGYENKCFFTTFDTVENSSYLSGIDMTSGYVTDFD